MRVTSKMASNSYYKNLNKSYEALMKAQTVNTTYRKFDSASEDPVSSLKAYRFRREVSQNTSYQANVSDLEGTVKTQESSISSLQTLVNKIKSTDYLAAINGTSFGNMETRGTYATKLRTLQASLVSDANVRYGGNYLFGGSGMSEPPFSVDTNGNLLYRGIDVNTGKIAAGTSTTINGVQIALGDTAGTYDGYTVKIADGTAADPVDINTTTKTITVTMNLSSGAEKTNEDLLSALKTKFANASMTGDTIRPVASDSALTTTARIGDVQLNLGDKAGTYNGYTIHVASGTDGVTVNDGAQTITVSMGINSGTTAEDLLKILKTDSRFSGASMSGNLSTAVSASTTAQLSSSHLPTSIAANTVGQAGLKALANEKSYVDIGSGLTFDSNGNINSQSAFNIAVPGISLLGFSSADGTGTGMSNNLYTLLDQIADKLEDSSTTFDDIKSYIDQFTKQTDLLSSAITTSGTNSTFLSSTADRLVDVGDNASTALDDAAYVDTMDAYQNFTTKYYGYQCALQIGTKLIESTILDYMR